LFKDELLKELQQERTLAELYQLFPEHSQPSIRGTVYKMLYAGQLERTDEGKYIVKGSGIPKSKTPAPPRKPDRKKLEVHVPPSAGKPVEPERMEPSNAGVTPPSTDMNQVLADALAKFSDPGTKDTTKRKTTKPRGADFDKAKDTLVENGYEFHEDFNLVWISADSIMDEEHMVAILPESAVTETSAIADAEVYRLPDSLVEKGRLLRTRKVRTNKRLINLPKVFDVLTDLKVRNS